MRASLKRMAEQVLAYGGASALSRTVHRRDGIVLSYHNIVPDGAPPRGDLALHLAQSQFANQLDLLSQTHDIVPLDTLMARTADSGHRPRAAITFDDAYAGALSVGLSELTQRGLPATIFVAPAFVGGHTFWWDDVSGADNGLSAERRSQLLHELQGRDDRIRASYGALASDASDAAPQYMRCATLPQLRRAAQAPGITYGVHTWSHPNLAALSDSEVTTELSRARDWLQARFANCIPWLAYPYGLSTRETEATAARLGFRGALLTAGGWLRATPRAFSLPRVDIPAGVSA
jgi:peptidoglycan/xylan/chitin deacetylase (PgdA/CDA1 family)